jgi:penicillin-binding protein 2
VVSSDYRTLVREGSPEIMSTMEIDEVTYMTYMQGMRQVISGPRGTGRDSFGGAKDWIGDSNGLWPYPDIEVCAKTGTAETFKDRSDNGAYICFAPMNDPQIAIAIYAERGAHGSTFSVVAEEIMRAYFTLGDSGDVIVQENKLG